MGPYICIYIHYGRIFFGWFGFWFIFLPLLSFNMHSVVKLWFMLLDFEHVA